MKVFNFPILQTQCGRGHWLGGHPGQTGQSIFQLQLQVWINLWNSTIERVLISPLKSVFNIKNVETLTSPDLISSETDIYMNESLRAFMDKDVSESCVYTHFTVSILPSDPSPGCILPSGRTHQHPLLTPMQLESLLIHFALIRK